MSLRAMGCADAMSSDEVSLTRLVEDIAVALAEPYLGLALLAPLQFER